MLYFAYGSNLSAAGMRERCPNAVAIGAGLLPAHRLVFRLWADVEPDAGSAVSGGLWRITESCLAALDAYEEVAAGLYRRHVLTVETGRGATAEALVYRMTASHRAPPDPDYLEIVVQGCRDFGLDPAPVRAAADAALA